MYKFRKKLPHSQDWLINKMKKSDYKSDPMGICHAITNMGIQAMLLKDTDSFDKRLYAIDNLPEEKIAEFIKQIRKKRKRNRVDPLVAEIPAFFEGVELYQNNEKYPEWFDNTSNVNYQNLSPVNSVLTPKNIKKDDPIVQIKKFTGTYTQSDLDDYLTGLENALMEIKAPCALYLGSSNHAIALGYDPDNHEWLIINANRLPTWRSKDKKEVANKIMQAFSKNGTAIFATEIYAQARNASEITNAIESWQKQISWKKIHKVTQTKSHATDSHNASWIFVCAQNNDLETLRKLLKKATGDLVNKPNNRNVTALYFAAQNGHLEVVKTLLNANANPNQGLSDDGATPLFIAAQNGQLEVVKALLNSNANPNQARTDDGCSPLYIAAQLGHLEIVKELLKANANPSQACLDDGSTPISVATDWGRLEIKQLLLDAEKNRHKTKSKKQGLEQSELLPNKKHRVEIDVIPQKSCHSPTLFAQKNKVDFSEVPTLITKKKMKS